jgi:hypothetical protein
MQQIFSERKLFLQEQFDHDSNRSVLCPEIRAKWWILGQYS